MSGLFVIDNPPGYRHGQHAFAIQQAQFGVIKDVAQLCEQAGDDFLELASGEQLLGFRTMDSDYVALQLEFQLATHGYALAEKIAFCHRLTRGWGSRPAPFSDEPLAVNPYPSLDGPLSQLLLRPILP